MRICHFSDWHADLYKLPAADLYVCTGDIYDNYPVIDRDGALRTYKIDPANETLKQSEWAEKFVQAGGFRRYMGSPDSPIVCVRGNHDFIDLVKMFEGCNVTEFIDNELHEIAGLKITGHRGIPYINGDWSDEVMRPDLLDRVRAMPEAHLFLTHYPPSMMLDSEIYNGRVMKYGLDGMPQMMINKMSYPVGIHCFGHIHGSGGNVVDSRQADKDDEDFYIFSNAACNVNVIDV